MRTRLGIAVLTSFCLIAAPTVSFSKGTGGHSGGGHAGGGGHASGAHGGGRAGSGTHQAVGSAAPARARCRACGSAEQCDISVLSAAEFLHAAQL